MVEKTLSVCMIVKNEEKYLTRCLESIRNQVDEIIIVDTGSTDNTVKIAEEFGARVYHYEWKNDFADARNFSINKASYEYILVLDADEFLDHDARIKEVLSLGKDYYVLNIKNNMSNGYVSYHQAIRLFKNNINLSYYGKIHEHLNVDESSNLTNGFGNFIIHHDGYMQDTFKEKDKYNRNIEILLKEVSESPSGYNLFNLGVQYKVGRKYKEALKALKKSYFLSKDQVYVPYLLYQMGDCLLMIGKIEDGINLMKDATKLFPKYTGFYFMLGTLYSNKNYLLDAEYAYKKCLELGEVKYFQTIEGVGSYLASIKLSEVLQRQGKLIEALNHSFNAIVEKKNFAPAISQYLNVLIQSGIEKDEIYKNIKQVFPINNSDELLLLLGVLLAKRSKLLLDLIIEYNLKVDEQLLLIALLYGNKYEEAYLHLNDISVSKEEYLIDILSLAILRNDGNLKNEIVLKLNLEKEEKEILLGFLNDGNGDITKLTDKVIKIIVKSISNFINMNEKQLFINMANMVSVNEKIAFELKKQARLLGFSEYVICNENINNIGVSDSLLSLQGDIYLTSGNLAMAIQVYNGLYNSTPDYQHLNKLYNFYEKINDTEGMNIILKEMSLDHLSMLQEY
ncbi:glycosyltransferase [Fredinandcohnia sp. QZ13]|uniref:glycosyltransferase n=1 Tax=Fredinandcohnia sp. QZ13 TaxID=3073144 RepID=UPI002853119C|nr:glycosyltransferase [Fredinandcohnia sp. QZ13]MDR4889993.1 glycosyltransferase [Fredinandcohnia sp. QZ13]